MPKKANKHNVVDVLRKFATFLEEDGSPDDKQSAADEINCILDEWLMQDAFGTEGQLDPRGDNRS
jgi:hypothetical protein